MRSPSRHHFQVLAGVVFYLCLGIAAGSLASFAVPFPVAAQSRKAPAVTRQKYIFLLPDGFKGWICVDFSIAGAAPLPREGDVLVVRPRQGEVLSTSDSGNAAVPILYGEAWLEVNGERRPLPKDLTLQSGPSRIGPNEPTQRECAFFGTLEEREAAGDHAPGFESLSEDHQHIPMEERMALEALYRSTDGDHWTHHGGWLGPEGTECKWHGITCATPNEPAYVTHIELSENNLSGDLPEALAGLDHLEEINIVLNHLSGKLPDTLIRKWLSGSLWIIAEPSAFTDVAEVDYESLSVSILCANDRLILRSDGTAKLFTEKCRNKTSQDRVTYCEVKEGRVFGGTFGTLSALLEKNRFYSLRRKYYRPVTDSSIDSLRVVRGEKTYEVEEYAGGSPYEFWVITGFITGLEAGIGWEKTTSISKCPAWEKGRVP
jgi:hypothetical protein